METIICPYCDAEIKVSQIEAEEGCCPECGAAVSPSAVFDANYDDDEYEDDYNDAYDDDYDDLEDDEFLDDIDDDDFDDDEDKY